MREGRCSALKAPERWEFWEISHQKRDPRQADNQPDQLPKVFELQSPPQVASGVDPQQTDRQADHQIRPKLRIKDEPGDDKKHEPAECCHKN